MRARAGGRSSPSKRAAAAASAVVAAINSAFAVAASAFVSPLMYVLRTQSARPAAIHRSSSPCFRIRYECLRLVDRRLVSRRTGAEYGSCQQESGA